MFLLISYIKYGLGVQGIGWTFGAKLQAFAGN